MSAPFVLESHPVVICQCVMPCLLPFRREDGEWSPAGCLRPKGHEPPCSLDGAGVPTYRDQPERIGPRVVLRYDDQNDAWVGLCHRCQRAYVLS